MSEHLDPVALTGQLAAQHGGQVPMSLIRSTVDTATAGGANRDALDAERIARADVAALADAMRRRQVR